MPIRTLMLAVVLVSGGCGNGASDDASDSVSQNENFQLPDVSHYIQAGKGDHGEDVFARFGVRDEGVPNMLLNSWLSQNAPEPSLSSMHDETVRAMRDDSAIAIDLHDVPLTPDLRSQIEDLKRVEWLSISAGVTGADFRWLGNIINLRGLAVTNANLKGSDLRHLQRLKSLQWLTFSWSEMTESDFATLPYLSRLQTLWLEGNHVTDAYLKHLAKLRLPSLKTIGLYYTSATDAGMHDLCQVYDLEYLDVFTSRKITSRSVRSIGRMNRLQSLGVGGSGISPDYSETDAVKEIRRLRPGCRVDFGD